MEPEWLLPTTGIITGLAFALRSVAAPGDKVLIQPPVYNPFKLVIEGNRRQAVENPLRFDGERYTMDLEHLERVVAEERPKLMILCNPHNPIGIQWDRETLARVAGICREGGMKVVSDEIHGDLMLYNRRHIPFIESSDDAREIGIMLGAPSKTFNIPGLVSSWMIIKNPALRHDFYEWLEVNEFSSPMMISIVGAEEAYRHGKQWLDEMLAYVESNLEFACDYVNRNIPGVKIVRPEASFLLWVDFRRLGLCQKELMDMLLDKAHIALNDGTMFGRQGEGFARLNIGCPRSVLAEALDHIRQAVETVCHCDKQ